MTNSTENHKLKEEVLRKIGRNVVNFQKIEAMLKQLIVNSSFKGPVREIKARLEDKKNSIDRYSMGTLTREYFKMFPYESEDFHDYPEEREESWMSLSVSIENKDGSIPKHKKAISFMVSERNRLIHQMLVNFDPDSIDSCQKLIVELDEQNQIISREYTNIQSLGKALSEAKKQLFSDMYANTINGDDG